ncbi:hypothetical protein ES703_79476 [subsurface metagenome]
MVGGGDEGVAIGDAGALGGCLDPGEGACGVGEEEVVGPLVGDVGEPLGCLLGGGVVVEDPAGGDVHPYAGGGFAGVCGDGCDGCCEACFVGSSVASDHVVCEGEACEASGGLRLDGGEVVLEVGVPVVVAGEYGGAVDGVVA